MLSRMFLSGADDFLVSEMQAIKDTDGQSHRPT